MLWLRNEKSGMVLHFDGRARGLKGKQQLPGSTEANTKYRPSYKLDQARDALERDALQILPFEEKAADNAGHAGGRKAVEFVRQVEFVLALRDELRRLAAMQRRLAAEAETLGCCMIRGTV